MYEYKLITPSGKGPNISRAKYVKRNLEIVVRDAYDFKERLLVFAVASSVF